MSPSITQQHLQKYFIVGAGRAGALCAVRTNQQPCLEQKRGAASEPNHDRGSCSPVPGGSWSRGAQPLGRLGPGVEADDGPVVPDQVPQLVQVGVDVLLHPLLHRVGEVDALQLGAQLTDEALPVLVEPGVGRAG